MTVSVLICTRNRPQDICWALPAVLANDSADYEVVVVDQSDDTQTADVVRPLLRAHSHLRYVRTQTRGLSRARNEAIGLAEGEIIAFTDDDCEPPADWVARIAALFAEDGSLDMVYGQVHQPANLPPNVSVPHLRFDTGRRLRAGDIFGMGANMAFRASLPTTIGGYDEVLGAGGPFGGGEDFDFSYRAQRAGLGVAIEPSLVLVHRSYRTEQEWEKVIRTYGTGDAAFHGKHLRFGDPWARRKVTYTLLRCVVRGGAKRILRRPGLEFSYLRGYREGLAASRALRVDPATRLYVPNSASAPFPTAQQGAIL